MGNSKRLLLIIMNGNGLMKRGLSIVFMIAILLSVTTCKTTVNGCTDSSAINYNSKATQDDGS